MTESSLESLLTQVALGNRSAFDRLYDATSAKLFGICLRILKEQAAAEDALQEAYVKVWRSADQYSGARAKPISWLAVIARNAAIDYLRRSKGGRFEDGEIHDIADLAPNPEQQATLLSEASRLNDCIGELAPDHASMIRGAYFRGWTYKDISAQLATPVNTIKSAVRRSLMKLRDCLERFPA
ncbi:MAG: sigma-70 family RNA polymerase sigma factor [Amphiplicatus sp.]